MAVKDDIGLPVDSYRNSENAISLDLQFQLAKEFLAYLLMFLQLLYLDYLERVRTRPLLTRPCKNVRRPLDPPLITILNLFMFKYIMRVA